MELQHELNRLFGLTAFRDGQEETIVSLLEGHDTLAQLPTGTGKSLCYQMVGYLKEGLVVIVSPLISLMEDQVSRILHLGERRVACINSASLPEERASLLNHLSELKFLFMSPEMIQNTTILAHLTRQKIALFVVDEAHCISQWGFDFRPEYRLLGEVKKRLGSPVTLALTATATEQVRIDIKKSLLSGRMNEFVYSVDRPNIALFVKKSENKLAELEELLMNIDEPTIIYCATRKKVEELYGHFCENYSIGYYHGGLSTGERSLLQKQFKENYLQILIATNAFGMGIDKPDIRYVLHYDLPDSVENYVQEIGRAGRDGQESFAVLFYQKGDEQIHYYFQDQARDDWVQKMAGTMDHATVTETKYACQKEQQKMEANQQEKKRKLQQMLGYLAESVCRRKYLLNYFGEKNSGQANNCCDLHDATLDLKKNSHRKQKTKRQDEWEEILKKIFKE
jgi:ATP-dependent DNA helicase RecQ